MSPKCLTLVLAALLAIPAAASRSADAVANEWFKDATDEQIALLPEGPDGVARIREAAQSAAYASAWSLVAEATAKERSNALWEDAQDEASPPAWFKQELVRAANAEQETLAELGARLAAASEGTLRADRAERLLAAAHILVRAESKIEQAFILVANANPDGLAAPMGRYFVMQPLALATVLLDVAEPVLAAAEEPGGTGPPLDRAALAERIQASGGSGRGWSLLEAGPLHGLARHAFAYQTGVFQQQASVERLGEALSALHGASDDLRAAGLAGVGPALAASDVAWWLGQWPAETTPAWEPLGRELNASAASALYEAELLASAIPRDESLPWGLIAGAAGTAALAIGAAGAFLWHRGRARGSAPRPRPGASRLGILAGLTATLLLVVPALAYAQPEQPWVPGDPLAGSVTLAPPDVAAAMPHLAVADDGVVHVVWHECPGTRTPGCIDVRHRSYDPASRAWTPASTLRDSAQDALRPRIHAAGNELHLLWEEGGPMDEGKPLVLFWCRLAASACADTAPLSDPTQHAANARAAADPQGRLRVVWQEETLNQEDSATRVVMRERGAGGWGPTVAFPTGSTAQRSPAVAVDGDGRTHVAWRQVPRGLGTEIDQELMYATVGPGSATANTAQRLSHVISTSGEVALEVQDGLVHAIYTTNYDVYHRSRGPDEPDWSAPLNVSRFNARKGPVSPSLHATPEGGLLATWVTGSKGTFAHWAAEALDGVWSQRRALMDQPPGNTYFLYPSVDVGPSGAVNVAWSGSGPETGEAIRARYRVLGEHPPEPPSIAAVLPAPEGWSRDDPVALAAHIFSEAGIDLGATRWLVDGAALSPRLEPDGSLAAEAAWLAEGWHESSLTLVDRNGRSAHSTWRFAVDRSAPAPFEAQVVQGGDRFPSGWSNAPIEIRAAATQDGGSPVRMQLQYNGGSWSDLAAVASIKVPEGHLLAVRLRAIDAAGNVHLGDPMALGWDATPPDLRLDVPAWSRADVLRVATAPAARAGGHGDHDHADAEPGHSHADVPAALMAPGAPIEVHATLRRLDGSEVLRLTADADADLVFPSLEEGLYNLSIMIRDGAGNRQEPAPGPWWTVGVDSTPPALAFAFRNGTVSMSASDALSGLRHMAVETPSGIVERSWDGAPESAAEIVVGDAAGVILARAFDAAGNEHVQRFDLATGQPLPVGDAQASGTLAPQAHGSDQPGQGAPVPIALPLAALAVALLVARARPPGPRQV